MEQLIESMKIVLGTGFSLYLKAHSYHWNILGEHFPSYHPFLGEIYTTIWESLDDFAEQIRQLDAQAPGSMERFIKLSRIQSDNSVPNTRQMMINLFNDTEIFIALLTETLHMAEQADKQGLVNFLAGRIEVHSKMRWQLRATANRLKDSENNI